MANNQPKVYRQKNPKRIILRVLLCILIIIFVFAFIALLGFRKYIAYSETGKLYLDIPWLSGYMDGEPETDDLAQYLTPVSDDTPEPDDAPDTASDTPDEADGNRETPEKPVSDIPDDTSSPQDTEGNIALPEEPAADTPDDADGNTDTPEEPETDVPDEPDAPDTPTGQTAGE